MSDCKPLERDDVVWASEIERTGRWEVWDVRGRTLIGRFRQEVAARLWLKQEMKAGAICAAVLIPPKS